METTTDPRLKGKLLLYLLVSAISFTLLVLPERAGVSVPIFMLIQAGFLAFLLPEKRALVVLIPILILALNPFLSANSMWQVPNLFVAALLYSLMALWLTDRLSLARPLTSFLKRICGHVIEVFSRFHLPVRWITIVPQEHRPTVKRVILGISLAIPVLIILSFVLAMADEIFLRTITRLLDTIFPLNVDRIRRAFLGLCVGFYLFGVLYSVFTPKRKEFEAVEKPTLTGDVMIFNIVLTAALLVYTLFVVIQFRYLFAPPNQLPYGLNFVTYARRGFFELLALTGANILAILLTVHLTKSQTGTGAKFTKILCLYLCAVTVVLLISSFYRMWLYGSDDGLTRLRLLVFGFLFFEAIGLLFTFVYILKPNFNIVAVYCLIALSYYLLLNLVPIDRIIARDQVNRYFETGRGGITYTLTLSPDAAPEIARLFQSENPETRERAQAYLNAIEPSADWRQWNLSRDRALHLRR
ncbi:MAG: DUF4173 domain-containing protein [Oscillospiraceae bacterium]|nr:DUF4173 domain-containing protein [Oscillospiraceae bacterium]